MAKRILNWSKVGKIFTKILLMLICCAGLSIVPLLAQNTVKSAFVFPADSGIVGTEAAKLFNRTMLTWFAGFLVLMLLINLVFFIIDEYRNDLVKWRRRLQVVINICIIISGLIAGYLLVSLFKQQTWWKYIENNESLLNLIDKWIYLAFGLCSAFQFFWDVWLFGPENRSPLIAKWLHRSALKQELKKGSRT